MHAGNGAGHGFYEWNSWEVMKGRKSLDGEGGPNIEY